MLQEPCKSKRLMGLWVSSAILPHVANKRRTRYNLAHECCRVSFTDTNGIPHDVEVQAESLYEAVALAVAEFRADMLTAEVGPMTEFVIAIHRPAVEHRLRLNQVTQWAQGTRDGPAGVIKRQRIMSLLNHQP